MLDLDFVRAQFPTFSSPAQQGKAFFENAGGSFMCRQVIDRLCDYYRHHRVQPYYPYDASLRAGEAMDASYPALARYLGITPEHIYFGPSTSQNTYVLAQAFRQRLQPGDEIIVTNQDHEANSGVWRALSSNGVVIREWQVDPDTGALDDAGLAALLGDRTRLVCFPHCSNILGQINPAANWCAMAQQAGAWTVVDGVSYAGHALPDIGAIGADIYLLSLYKTFGPHQGLMSIKPALASRLGNQAHYFNGDFREKHFTPAGPDHAQVAAAQGVTEYLDVLWQHHDGDGDAAAGVRALFHHHERDLMTPLLAYLHEQPNLRLLGPQHAVDRAPTLSVVFENRAAAEVVQILARSGIQCGGSHFYSVRLLEAMGLDARRGVVRFSMVHYNSKDDVQQLITALEHLKA